MEQEIESSIPRMGVIFILPRRGVAARRRQKTERRRQKQGGVFWLVCCNSFMIG